MWYEDLFRELEASYDKEQSIKMAKYMQNKFKFLGIPRPKLTPIMKPYLKEAKKYDMDWDFVYKCFAKDYREAQYVGIEYLMQNAKRITDDSLSDLKRLITTKSWWETVDLLDALVGNIVLKDKKYEKEMLAWSKSDDMWLRRVSIDYQQRFKELTNKELLENVILNNLGSDEFFINKAIGWSLREYSKTNATWVSDFLKKYHDKMNKLSIKEASKYL